MTEPNDITSYRSALSVMDQLVASGVKLLVASPGFRNSPLLRAAQMHPSLEVISAVDERGGAFLALGWAKAERTPAAVLCTSGTAVANFFPAVLEASHAHVPLVVLSADRPFELVGTGANQCMDQNKIFGSHVRFFAEVLGSEAGSQALEHVHFTVGRAVAAALQPQPGPVHLNLRFREPFLPSAAGCEAVEKENRAPKLWKFLPSASGPRLDQLEAVEEMLAAAARPLLVLGPESLGAERKEHLSSFLARTNIPVLSEAASGFPQALVRTEALFTAMAEGKVLAPDLVLRLGAPVTGKALGQLLAHAAIPQVVFEEWGEAREPTLAPSLFIQGGAETWLRTLGLERRIRGDAGWKQALSELEASVERRLAEHLQSSQDFTEWHFHRLLAARLEKEAALFLGNSMPIRDFNSVVPGAGRPERIFSNRGLSGIDGLLATAAGVALAHGRETHAVIGDLSTLHDLSSFSLLSALREKIQLTLWVLNNKGGEIFRLVGTAHSGGNQEWFTTPQDFDLSAIAKAFRLPYTIVRDQKDFADLPTSAEKGVRVIEVLFAPAPNLQVRQGFRAF